MLRNQMTIMIIPQKSGRVFRFRLSSFMMNVAFLLLGGVIIGSSFLFIDYMRIRKRESDQRNFQQMIIDQKFKIREINNKLAIDQQELDELRDFEKKLRIISGFKDASPHLRVPGNGNGYSSFQNGITEQDDSFLEKLNVLDYEVKNREVSFFQLEAYLQEQKDRLGRTPSISPMKGYFSSQFGYRSDPLTGKRRQHNGIDIVNNMFTPIYAPADGVVVGTMTDNDFGYFLVIDHGYDTVSRYGHIAKFEVKVGQYVKRGDLIARMGNEGRSSGPHLHYEILVKDKYVNPSRYILDY